MNQLRIIHRKSFEDQFSIENLAYDIAKSDKSDVVRISVARFKSRRVLRKLLNLFWAFGKRSTFNHLIGDINYISLALKRRKTILTIHDCAYAYGKPSLMKWAYSWFWLRLPVRHAGIITTVSNFTKMQLVETTGVDPGKVHVIHNFYSPIFSTSLKRFNSDYPVLLQVGTHKNIERVIKALAGINCHYRIIGRLTLEQTNLLNEYEIDYSNKIDLTNHQIYEEYLDCDMVTFVSCYEGFGIPIIEAQKVGRPVITSNVAAIPEIAGDGALLVDPRSIREIRKGILKIIFDHTFRDELVQRGLANVQQYSPEVQIPKYHNLYKELIHKNTGQGIDPSSAKQGKAIAIDERLS